MIDFLFVVIFLSNLVIGILLGLSGISGFLLPLIYVGFLGLPLSDSLTLSFAAFAVSGIIGAYSYWQSENMNVRLAVLLSAGGLPGAYCGVLVNHLIPDHTAKLLLYLFILFSGLSLLVKKQEKSLSGDKYYSSKLVDNKRIVILLGFITAAVCSLTGAGGPIVVVPLLVHLGINPRVAVGVSLFNSVIIACPAIAGYLAQSNALTIMPLLAQSLSGMIIGILIGVYFANQVQLKVLRILIAVLTICSSVYMLYATIG